MRVLIITSCTGEKRGSDERQLTISVFRRGHEHVADRERSLTELLLPAENLYTGQQHVRLMQGVRRFRELVATRNGDGSDRLDLLILSAGYGFLRADRAVAPYECTFEGMP